MGETKKQDVKKEEAQEAPRNPFEGQCTFTEDEINKVTAFVNFAYEQLYTKQGLNGKEMRRINQMFNDIGQHINKCKGYIFDLEKSFAVDPDGKVTGMK